MKPEILAVAIKAEVEIFSLPSNMVHGKFYNDYRFTEHGLEDFYYLAFKAGQIDVAHSINKITKG